MNNRTKIVTEVLAVFLLFAGILWSVKLVPGFSTWQAKVFEGNILTILLGMILLPAAVMWFRQTSEVSTSLTMPSLKKALETGGKSLGVMMPVTFLSFPVIQMLGYSFLGWRGALIIAGWHILALPLLCLVFKEYEQGEDQLLSKRELGILTALFATAPVLVFALALIHPIAAKLLIALVFIGQAEEFLFRGYIQTRLNQAFEKPFSLFGFSYGWGIIFASLLFGLMHVLSPGNPWHWAWGFWTFFGGLCFGVIREKGGTFVASGLVHGIIMIFPVIFS